MLRKAWRRLPLIALIVLTACEQAATPSGTASPTGGQTATGARQVRLTWMGMANVLIQVDKTNVLFNTYFSRLATSDFTGEGPVGLLHARSPLKPDPTELKRVLGAYGNIKLDYILTGHSHFDHSWETAAAAQLTNAKIIGPPSTCFQAFAQGIAGDQCTSVLGGEEIALGPGVKVRVVRLNHSGDPITSPTLHNPLELTKAPTPDPATGGLRAGIVDDFPNGGGGRGFLFTIDSPGRPLSFFLQDSASAVDFEQPVVVAGVDYGIPSRNMADAMKKAKLDAVDLWIYTGGKGLAQLATPILKPKFAIPNHWEGLFSPISKGLPTKYADAQLQAYMADQGIKLLPPCQLFDSWTLGADGVKSVSNKDIKEKLGLKDCQF